MNNDIISRSALKEAIEPYRYAICGFECVLALIDNAPTVPNEYMRGYEAAEREYKRPHGEWIIDGHHYKCSRCGKTLAIMFSETDDDLIGCPFCLADMRGGRG